MSTFSRRLGTNAASEKGAVLIMAAVSMLALMGFMGLALDVGSLYHHERVMQTAADAGALGGGAEIFRAQSSLVTPSALTATTDNGFADGIDSVAVTVNHPPASGFYTGDAQYVEVLISQPTPTYFMQLFGWTTVPVAARAVAGVGANGPNCIYLLEPTASTALELNSNATVTADCGMVINSSHASAIRLTSNASVTATTVSVTGDIEGSGAITTTASSGPRTGVPPSPDPLAYLTPPAYAGCDYDGLALDDGTTFLTPGVYCRGITLKSNAHAILTPGVYVMRGGGILMESSTVLEGDGVTIFLTDGGYEYNPVNFQSSTQVRLAAPTTGPYAGILFYQDPNAGMDEDVHKYESSSNSFLEGALYFPTQVLLYESSSTREASYTITVARVLQGESSAVINVNADYSSLPGGSPIKRLSLVE